MSIILTAGLCTCIVVFSFVDADVRIKRNDDSLKQLVTCGSNAEANMVCPAEKSVSVESISFKRTDRKDIQCSPDNALSKLRSLCDGKRDCTIFNNDKTLGKPLDEEGSPCKDNVDCLQLGYKCFADCKKPVLNRGIAVVGQQYSVNSVLQIHCKKGFVPYNSGGEVVTELRCEESGNWSGSTVNCHDKDECAHASSNVCDRHADCVNTVGSYTCSCGKGYIGDGFTCNPDNVDRPWVSDFQNVTDDLPSSDVCGGKIFENNGVITTPNYPGTYPRDVSCQWIVTVSPNRTVQMSFLNFALEEPLPEGCTQDYVKIYDGPERSPRTWMDTLCGSQTDYKLESTGNQVRIEFKSDNAIGGSGFQMHFKSNSKFAHCDNFIGPGYPGAIVVNGTRNQTVKAGSAVTLACDDGYTLNDHGVVRMCENDNSWNDSTNPCRPVRCSSPTPINTTAKATGDQEEFHFGGSPVIYECMPGFAFTNVEQAKVEIFCNKQGRWSNENDTFFPVCSEISCSISDKLYPPAHGTWSLYRPNGQSVPITDNVTVPFDSYIIYACHKEYATVGEPKRTCVGNSAMEWSGRPIVCEEDNGIPGLTNFQIALIVAVISGVIVLVVGVALVCCCVRGKRRDSRKLVNRTYQHRHDRARFDNQGFSTSQVDDFVYSYPSGRHGKRPRRQQQQTVVAKSYRPNQPAGNDQQPYYLPSTMQQVPMPHMISADTTMSNGNSRRNGQQRVPNPSNGNVPYPHNGHSLDSFDNPIHLDHAVRR